MINHYHEVIGSVTKIFFDLDMKIPLAVYQDKELNEYCRQQLEDSGECYAEGNVSYFGNSLE